MKKKFFAVLTVVMFALGGCSDNSVRENEALLDEGASGSVGAVTANDETEAAAENVTEEVTESVSEAVTESAAAVTTKKETETTVTETVDLKQRFEEMKKTQFLFVRTSEDESKTLTIDSEIFPYDCEEIIINVDTEAQNRVEIEGYDYLDLENLKNYPNLKRLELADTNSMGRGIIKIINGGSAAGLENLEEISLHNNIWWEEDWLSGISFLKNLSITNCHGYDGRFLENLPQVETLYICGCNIEDLSFVNGMNSLTDLGVDAVNLNNASLDGINENYTVKRLLLGSNSYYFGDALLTDITAASKFRGLEYLEIWGGDLKGKDNQIKELQERLPACEISCYGG